jgi:hypothetical protein
LKSPELVHAIPAAQLGENFKLVMGSIDGMKLKRKEKDDVEQKE